jgi:hypothetical protein
MEHTWTTLIVCGPSLTFVETQTKLTKESNSTTPSLSWNVLLTLLFLATTHAFQITPVTPVLPTNVLELSFPLTLTSLSVFAQKKSTEHGALLTHSQNNLANARKVSSLA